MAPRSMKSWGRGLIDVAPVCYRVPVALPMPARVGGPAAELVEWPAEGTIARGVEHSTVA